MTRNIGDVIKWNTNENTQLPNQLIFLSFCKYIKQINFGKDKM